MFVSSYSTNVQVSNSDKLSKESFQRRESNTASFSSKLSTTTQTPNLSASSIAVDYISKGLVLSNKQALENQKNDTQNPKKDDLDKFMQKNSLLNAKSAYEGNSKIFSLFSMPNTVLSPSIEKTLPEEATKKLHLQNKMVNTYIANDNYYKVTA